MATSAVEALKEDFLHCSICTNRFKVPKILPCIHSFCQTCLEKYVQRLKSQQLPCPICRKVCDLPETGVKGLQTNFHLVNLADRMDLLGRLEPSEVKSFPCDSCESTDASAYCLECDCKVCLKCQNDHKRFPVLRSHSIIPIGEIKQPKYRQALQNARAPCCDIHPTENLRFYCKTCSKLICRDCTIVEHPKPDHNCVEAACQVDEITKDLLKMLSESSSHLKSSLEFVEKGKAGSEEVERQNNSLTQEIKSTYEGMMVSIEKQLRDQMKKMCEEVTEFKTVQRNSIDEKVDKASSWVTRLKNTQEVTKKVIKENNMWEILSMSHDLISAFQVLKFDAGEFRWHRSDLHQMMVFSPHEAPCVTLGTCNSECDVVLCDDKRNFIKVKFDRHSSMLQLIRIRHDNDYDLANADHGPPYKVEPTIPSDVNVTAVFTQNGDYVFVGLGRWIFRFNSANVSFDQVFETSKDKDTSITFLACSEHTSELYLMQNIDQCVKQFTNFREYYGSPTLIVESILRNTELVIPNDHISSIENVSYCNSSMLYFCKGESNGKNSKLYLLTQRENVEVTIDDLDIIKNRQQLSLLRFTVDRRKRTMYLKGGKSRKHRYIDTYKYCVSCFILWSEAELNSYGLEANLIITEYRSEDEQISHVWNVPKECAPPAVCFKDDRTNQLVICDRHGKVSTCFNYYENETLR